MAKSEVEIKITGNTEDAQSELKRLEAEAKKAFDGMSDSAKKEAAEVEDAFKKSGLRTEKDIKKSSLEAQRNYSKIKKSGTASANDIRRAHDVMTAKLKKNNKELQVSSGLIVKGLKSVKKNIVGIGLSVVATGIAIKGIFDFAESAAKLKAQRLAFKNFTENLGHDSDELLKKLTEVSRGTVSQADLISSAGTAMLLGLDPSKITELMEIARAASKITGQALTTQFEDIAKGTGRASKLILDNLGVMFSQEEATRRAALAAGVAASALTDQQVALGNLMEVIRQGKSIIQGVGEDFTSQADVLGKVRARYKDFIDIAGQKFLRLMPKIEIFVLKVSRAFLVFTHDLSQTLKHFSRFTDFIHLTTGAVDRSEHSILNLSKSVVALDAAIADAEKAQLEFNKAELQAAENSKKAIALAKERKDIRKDEEQLITANKNIQIDAINATAAAQKVQNESLKKAISSTKEELRRVKSEAESTAAFAQQILDEIAGSQKKRAQSGFDPLQVLIDDLKRAEDDFKKASKERTAGNIENAQKLTLSAVQAANAILEVKKGANDESEITQGGLNRATTSAEKLVEAAKRFSIEMKNAGADAVPVVEQQLSELETKLAAGEDTLARVKTDITEATTAAELLKSTLGQDTTATHTQIINTVNTGGNGGPGFNTGGHIPGYGGGDTVPIMAEPGEHIIRKESVKKFGRGAAQAFNRGDIAGLFNALPVQKFNEGGEVQGQGSPAANVNLIMGDKSFPVTATENVAAEFISEIKNMNIIRSRKKNPY